MKTNVHENNEIGKNRKKILNYLNKEQEGSSPSVFLLFSLHTMLILIILTMERLKAMWCVCICVCVHTHACECKCTHVPADLHVKAKVGIWYLSQSLIYVSLYHLSV